MKPWFLLFYRNKENQISARLLTETMISDEILEEDLFSDIENSPYKNCTEHELTVHRVKAGPPGIIPNGINKTDVDPDSWVFERTADASGKKVSVLVCKEIEDVSLSEKAISEYYDLILRLMDQCDRPN